MCIPDQYDQVDLVWICGQGGKSSERQVNSCDGV